MRDPSRTNGDSAKEKGGKKRQPDIDSDDDLDAADDVVIKAEAAEDNDINAMLSPDDARRQGELADGVQKIRVSIPSSSLHLSQSPY